MLLYQCYGGADQPSVAAHVLRRFTGPADTLIWRPDALGFVGLSILTLQFALIAIEAIASRSRARIPLALFISAIWRKMGCSALPMSEYAIAARLPAMTSERAGLRWTPDCQVR